MSCNSSSSSVRTATTMSGLTLALVMLQVAVSQGATCHHTQGGALTDECQCSVPFKFVGGPLNLTPKCCSDLDRCCPAAGSSGSKFQHTADDKCCDAEGICCELNAGSCTCKNGHELGFKTLVDGEVLANTYEPNGCLAETWVQHLNEGLTGTGLTFRTEWTKACSSHAKCYVNCSNSQEECDIEFKKKMKKACSNKLKCGLRPLFLCRIRKELCKAGAEVLYKAIRPRGGGLGGPVYRLGRQEYCKCGGALRRLDIVV